MFNRPVLAVLDASALAGRAAPHVLLRLAEVPASMVPRWTRETLAEARSLLHRLGWPDPLVEKWESALQSGFPEAVISPATSVVAALAEADSPERTVAAAVACGARLVLTEHPSRHPPALLRPWGVEAMTPETFLLEQLGSDHRRMEPMLRDMIQRHTHPGMMAMLTKNYPSFAQAVAGKLDDTRDMN
jgi:hypothetical protein